MKHLPIPWTLVAAYTTGGTKRMHPVTGWLTAAQFKRIKFILETISLQTNMSITFCYETANVENTPIAQYTLGSAITTNTVTYGTLTDISADLNGTALVRFGVLCENTAAATLIIGRIGGSIEYLST